MKKLYRYEIQYTNGDGPTDIRLREFPVVRETDYCYWIQHPGFYMKQKRVRKNAYNTYTYDNKEKSKEHFIRRTKNRIRWFNFWIEECKAALVLIEHPETHI